MKVEVVRSARRRKTVQARQVGGVLRISIPASMTRADEERWVAEMVRRMSRHNATRGIDLASRAATLAARYQMRMPVAIKWVDNQEWRWGSCTPSDRTIRISSRLAKEPAWVLDYVIVHELAHLSVAKHNAQFWALVQRYPKAELARGFLIARGLDAGLDEPPTPAEHRPEHRPELRPPPARSGARPPVAKRKREAAARDSTHTAPRLPGF